MELAARCGVGVLAVTDHDTVASVDAAAGAGAALGVRVIAGVEISVRAPAGSMHLLAYFPGAPPPAVVDTLAGLARARGTRAARILERLEALGVPVAMDDVAARAGGPIGRPHIADALVAAGHVRTRQDAFNRYLADGGPAWVAHDGLGPEDAVRLVREAGGAPVLAHPGTLRLTPDQLRGFVGRIAGAGLVGIEVHRPEHLPEQRHRYGRIASGLGLIPSGGSDFHGPAGVVRPGDTGEPPLPPDIADRLLEAAAA